MKKIKKIECVIILFLLFLVPLSVQAKTISDFEAEINKFTKDLEEKQARIAKNDQEVAAIKENISKIEGQITTIEREAESLQEEIDRSNEEIAQKSKESQDLFQYLQVSEGKNVYLEYIFKSDSITDMIYRISVVEQLTQYNEKVMNELEALIEKNKVQKDQLAAKKEELKKLRSNLESEKERINADSAAVRDTMPSVQQQLKEAKDNLSYYKKLGCGVKEDIYACQYRIEQAKDNSGGGGSLPSVDGFSRPMVSGYVTQNYSGYGGHLGIDLSNTNKTMPIYPVAEGVITRIYYDDYKALCVTIRHNVGGRYIYSSYAHLSSWANIKENQHVTPSTQIGNMGNSGYSFGAHLHLEFATCHWTKGGGCSWSEYQKKTINPRQYLSFPSVRVWWNNK